MYSTNITTPRYQYKHQIAFREPQFRYLLVFHEPKIIQGHEVYI
jgi:hypothetical protein